MSSWIIAKGIHKKKIIPITSYHDTGLSPDIPSIYMEYLAACIYSQRMGEVCSIWDPTGIIDTSLKNNPLVKLLKEKPEIPPLSISRYSNILQSMKIKDIQKNANTILEHSSSFNTTLSQILEKGSIRQDYDIGLHIVSDPSNVINLTPYTDILKAYQQKTKKTSLSVYIMTNTYTVVEALQRLGNSSWKFTSLSKTAPKNAYEGFIQSMAESKVMAMLPALVLNFNNTVDRYIYLMHKTELVYFKELNEMPWKLV